MSATELRNKLIERIKETKDERLLEEAFRLFDLGSENFETYKLSDDQKKVVEESRVQFGKGQFYSNEQVNRDSDEWLEK